MANFVEMDYGCIVNLDAIAFFNKGRIEFIGGTDRNINSEEYTKLINYISDKSKKESNEIYKVKRKFY